MHSFVLSLLNLSQGEQLGQLHPRRNAFYYGRIFQQQRDGEGKASKSVRQAGAGGTFNWPAGSVPGNNLHCGKDIVILFGSPQLRVAERTVSP